MVWGRDRFFNFVAKAESHEAFLAVILLTVLAMSALTEGLGLSNTLGAFMAGVLLSETKYRYQVRCWMVRENCDTHLRPTFPVLRVFYVGVQVEADIAPFRGLLLGLFFMTVGFEIDLKLIRSQLPTVLSLMGGLLAVKASLIAAICLGFGLSIANSQQVGLLLSQGGEFAFVAFGIAKALGKCLLVMRLLDWLAT